MLEKLDEIEARFQEIDRKLQDPEIVSDPKQVEKLGRARASLDELVGVIREYKENLDNLEQAKEMQADPEMHELAEAELPSLNERNEALTEHLKLLLLPTDPNDDKPVIIEIRPAAGGGEAGLFAADVFRMYTRYAERRGWQYQLIEQQEAGIGGLNRVVFSIDAAGAFSQLKYESGVHRVQRVPETESAGRIHTSTITVAVLPEAEEVDVEIGPDDLEWSTFRSSSAGGQHMQKNDTAVRVIHKPTGLAITCQDERSQAQNKEKAMNVLRTRLYDMEQERLAKERGEMRKDQIGTGDRSEKIRTYNYAQSRITDHRIGHSQHNLQAYMDGDLQEMIDRVTQEEQARKLAQAETVEA